MFRKVLIAIGIASIFAGIVLLLSGLIAIGAYVLAEGAILTLALIFERSRYRKNVSDRGDWQPTGERFVDPGTGRLTEVRYNPVTGERQYVPAASEEGNSP
ncbi:MAG TPA: hypothetical protein VFK96_01170 [Gammaproteobacteria bacterium]|jgi:uncharacterized membrane protein HdeD (DUF308 family)|nr:hypothetical protein [Gammaproteobacteria bacterium]